MRKLHYSLAILALTATLCACSKKVTTFRFGQPYHTTTATTTSEDILTEEATIATSSTDETPNATTCEPVIVAKSMVTPSGTKTIEAEKTPVAKPSLKQKIATKIIAKKIEKLEKQNKGGGMNDKMKLGIVIAAVSLLVLIVVAAGLLGGLSSLFWLLGGLGLLTGLVIILLAALDVI